MISRNRCSADSTLKNPTNGFETLFRIIVPSKLRYYYMYIPCEPIK